MLAQENEEVRRTPRYVELSSERQQRKPATQ